MLVYQDLLTGELSDLDLFSLTISLVELLFDLLLLIVSTVIAEFLS
jgi:hypothetical protein